MKRTIKAIIVISLIIFSIIELILIFKICINPDRIFLFKFDIINGWDIFTTAFNIPLQILKYYAIILGILFTAYKIFSPKTNNYNLTKEQKYLVKQIYKRKISDFETLIIKFLKPQIRRLKIPYKINGTEFKPDDEVYVFDDPREIYLKIKSVIEVLNLIIKNNAIELISKYEKIDKSKTLNPFYVFTKPPIEKNYFWDKRLNDILYKNFGLTDFDKEIRPIENRLKQYIT